MKTISRPKIITVFCSIMLTILLAWLYFSLLILDPILRYDDGLLLGGAAKVHSFEFYSKAILSGDVLDLQPIRDLSYILDFKLKSMTSISFHHLSNLLIWFVICLVLKKILDLISDQKNDGHILAWSIVFLYALSPVSASSVAWIAARKHLLSTLFILLATWLFLIKRNSHFNLKSNLLISFVYLLSVLSHPINVLWPFFVYLYTYFDKKFHERKILLILLGILSLIILGANFYYYEYLYPVFTGGDGKYDVNTGGGLTLLAMGRYFYLTLFPFDALPVSHFQGSWKNLLGIPLLILFIYFCYKKNRPVLVCFILYFFLPLVPVTIKITRIFCSDTYLLNASIGIYASIFLLLEKSSFFKKMYVPIFVYAAALAIYNVEYLKIFHDEKKIWFYAYEKEPTPMSIANLAGAMIAQDKFYNAGKLIDQLEILEPENRFFIKLKADAIYKNPEIKDMDKVQLLEVLAPKRPVVFLYLALLYSNNNRPNEVRKNIVGFFSNAHSYIENSYLNNEKTLALIKVACEKNRIEADCKEHFYNFRNKVNFKNWNDRLYSETYFELKKNPGNLIY